MISDCIVTQAHVPDFDIQGGLPAADKRHLVGFGLKHLRAFNPDSYIVLTGHGHRPGIDYLSLCDYVYWNDTPEPLDEHGYVAGMPAQFKYVSAGLEHAKSMGFTDCLKTRGDCLIGHQNICQYCRAIVTKEQKLLLVTQQTGPECMGDCFMFGQTDLLCKIWSYQNRVVSSDGLQNTAAHFREAVGSSAEWFELVKNTCAFRDVDTLKFMCLRWNYFDLNRLDQTTCNQLLAPEFDFAKYHWGKKGGAHLFAPDRIMGGDGNAFYSERSFYQ